VATAQKRCLPFPPRVQERQRREEELALLEMRKALEHVQQLEGLVAQQDARVRPVPIRLPACKNVQGKALGRQCWTLSESAPFATWLIVDMQQLGMHANILNACCWCLQRSWRQLLRSLRKRLRQSRNEI
jgi:hypothetical protein